jgi:hypothetical protein
VGPVFSLRRIGEGLIASGGGGRTLQHFNPQTLILSNSKPLKTPIPQIQPKAPNSEPQTLIHQARTARQKCGAWKRTGKGASP